MKPRLFYGYVVAAAGFLIWMVAFGISNTFGIFYLPMMTEFNWQRGDTALAYSLGTFMMAVLAIVTGWMTDRLSPRIVVTVFGAFLGIAYLLMSQVSALWHFQAIYGLLVPVGMSVTTTPIMATVARWFVRRRGYVTGWVQSGLGLGGLIIAPLTGWLIVQYGWRTANVVLGVIALIGIILPGLFMAGDPREKGQFPDGRVPLTRLPEAVAPKKPEIRPMAMGTLIRTRQFWIVAAIYAIFGFCRTTFTAHTAAHVQDLGFSLIEASHVVAVLMASSIFGRIGMGRMADAIGNRSTFMISYAATTVSLLFALFTGSLWGLYAYAFVFGFGWGAQAVLRFGLTAETFGLPSLGLIMGIMGIGEAVAAALGAYYAGFVFDIIGSYHPAFWMGVVLSLVGIILAVLLKPVKKQPYSR